MLKTNLQEKAAKFLEASQRKGFYLKPPSRHQLDASLRFMEAICAAAIRFEDDRRVVETQPNYLPEPARPDHAAVCELALIASEIVEAYQECLKGAVFTYYENGKPEGLGPEAADVQIRLFNFYALMASLTKGTFDIDEFIEDKFDFNEKRPFKNGGKAF